MANITPTIKQKLQIEIWSTITNMMSLLIVVQSLWAMFDMGKQQRIFNRFRDGHIDLDIIMTFCSNEQLESYLAQYKATQEMDPESQLKQVIEDVTNDGVVNRERVIEMLVERMDLKSTLDSIRDIQAEYQGQLDENEGHEPWAGTEGLRTVIYDQPSEDAPSEHAAQCAVCGGKGYVVDENNLELDCAACNSENSILE